MDGHKFVFQLIFFSFFSDENRYGNNQTNNTYETIPSENLKGPPAPILGVEQWLPSPCWPPAPQGTGNAASYGHGIPLHSACCVLQGDVMTMRMFVSLGKNDLGSVTRVKVKNKSSSSPYLLKNTRENMS